jgi:hypothetical protein
LGRTAAYSSLCDATASAAAIPEWLRLDAKDENALRRRNLFILTNNKRWFLFSIQKPSFAKKERLLQALSVFSNF